MDDASRLRTTLPEPHATDVPGDVWGKVTRMAGAIKVCLDRHNKLLRSDPEYREAVEYLKTLMTARPGQVSQVIRVLSAGNMRLVKLL